MHLDDDFGVRWTFRALSIKVARRRRYVSVEMGTVMCSVVFDTVVGDLVVEKMRLWNGSIFRFE